MQRIQKLLSSRGYCSRRKGEELIKAGRVTVDGKSITIGDQAEEEALILVDGKEVRREQQRYLLFHKPTGYVTALTDSHERTIMELINIPERVYPVGRLDKETTGAIILTNDGDFANKIAHPRYEMEKTYEATVDTIVAAEDLKRLEEGVALEDGKTRPAKVNLLGERRVRVTIHEGKNRIVRRMFAALGYKVRALHRSSIGKVELGELRVGTWRALSAEEIESFTGYAG